jgi:hypothetical protein
MWSSLQHLHRLAVGVAKEAVKVAGWVAEKGVSSVAGSGVVTVVGWVAGWAKEADSGVPMVVDLEAAGLGASTD